MSTPGYLTCNVQQPFGYYGRGLPVEVLAVERDLGEVRYLIRCVTKEFTVPRAAVAFGDPVPVLCDVCAQPMPLARDAGMCIVCQRVLVGMSAKVRARFRVRQLAGVTR